MSNRMYDAFKASIVDAPNLFEPTEAIFYAEVERPCWHRFWVRWAARLRGRYHGRTHWVTQPLIRAALVDNANPANGETMTVTYDSRGVFRLD